MGFGKAFGFSLLTFVSLNFLFVIITYTISGGLNSLFADISGDYLLILIILFQPVANFPSIVLSTIYSSTISIGFTAGLIQLIGFFVSPFLGALIAGRTGEKKGGSFGGWLLTSMISAIALGILIYLSPTTLTSFLGIVVDPVDTLVFFLLGGLVMGIFYGCFALLFTKTEYY